MSVNIESGGDAGRNEIRISVVVPVFNAVDLLPTLLESLRVQSESPLEILIVDNGSTDATANLVTDWQVRFGPVPLRYLFEPKRGPGLARNTGAREAQGTHLAFFDADCVVECCWLQNARALVMATGAAVIGGVVSAFRTDHPAEIVADMFHTPPTRSAHSYYSVDEWGILRSAFETNNLLIKRDALLNIGGFRSESFIQAGEDMDLCIRLYRSGARMLCKARDLAVEHRHRATVLELLRQVMKYGVGYTEIIATHCRSCLAVLGWRRSRRWPFPYTVWITLSIGSVGLAVVAAVACLGELEHLFLCVAFLLCGGLYRAHKVCRERGLHSSASFVVQVALLIILHKVTWELALLRGSVKHRVLVL